MSEQTIETAYGGAKYRSRTEARWAVLFDKAGIGFQYEPEGFKLDSGWYLPDFWISGIGMYLEVKPDNCEAGPGHYTRERVLAEDLASLKQVPVLMALGSPREDGEFLYFEPDAIMPASRPVTGWFRRPDIQYAKSYRFDWSNLDRAKQARSLISQAARKLAFP